jgi:hypothetical protein
MKRLLLLSILLAAPSAHAEIALLENGMTLKIASRRAEGETVLLELKGGGEVGLPAGTVRGFVPDEVIDEVAPGAAAGGDIRALVAHRAPGPEIQTVAVEAGMRTLRQAGARKVHEGVFGPDELLRVLS